MCGSYAKGALAYDAWKNALLCDWDFPANAVLPLLVERMMCHGDAMDCLSDGRFHAAKYLRRLAELHPAMALGLNAAAGELERIPEIIWKEMIPALGGWERGEAQMRQLARAVSDQSGGIYMTKNIENIVSFPVNAQRNSFFGALSSILLYRNAFTEDTPFFCGKHQRNCIRCGICENELFINKHHLKIYQHLITITGCAYFWIDKEIGNSYNKQYIADEFSETALDRLSLALYASGYHYESMNKNAEANVLFDRIKQSIEEKQPVLIKLGLGDLWAVITGYNDNKNLPYLMKSRRSPQLDKDWYDKLSNIVFITDKYDSVISLSESLNHMIRHLNTSSRIKLEQNIYKKLDTELDGKKLGMWLNKINGLAIETRWHASECYRNTLVPMFDSNQYKKLLVEASDLHLHFHDQAWKIWGLLGVSPQTHYCLPCNVNELLDKSSTRAELKSLFQELFTIDRQVSNLLQESLSLL